ncbi:response regulator [Achromobacter insuavis]
MTLESEVGAGTSVRIFLPRHLGTTADSAAPMAQVREPGNRTHQAVILLVEDDVNVRDMVCECLVEQGMRVLTANDGDAGLERVRAMGHIDLLVTDVGLPGLNGRQLADAARVVHPGLKVLLMTGYAESAARGSGFLDRGMELIVKPLRWMP